MLCVDKVTSSFVVGTKCCGSVELAAAVEAIKYHTRNLSLARTAFSAKL